MVLDQPEPLEHKDSLEPLERPDPLDLQEEAEPAEALVLLEAQVQLECQVLLVPQEDPEDLEPLEPLDQLDLLELLVRLEPREHRVLEFILHLAALTLTCSHLNVGLNFTIGIGSVLMSLDMFTNVILPPTVGFSMPI